MRFDALEISLELIHSLKQPVTRIRSRDPKLYQQIRAAASSIALNLAEGFFVLLECITQPLVLRLPFPGLIT